MLQALSSMKPEGYSSYAGTIDVFSAPTFNKHIAHLINLISEISPQKCSLLDIGGGTGSILRTILEKIIVLHGLHL